jgi:hypothetical protein
MVCTDTETWRSTFPSFGNATVAKLELELEGGCADFIFHFQLLYLEICIFHPKVL